MIKKCDMCGVGIKDGKCSCGTWHDPEEMKHAPIVLGMKEFDEMKQFTLTADIPHLGCAVVYFRGDYNDCQKVKKFIYEMKNRPYYQENQ